MPTSQFEDYDDGLQHAQDDDGAATDPFLYEGERLNACNFPLGSFGAPRTLRGAGRGRAVHATVMAC